MKLWAAKTKHRLKLYRYILILSLKETFIFRINTLLVGLAPLVWLGTIIIFLTTLFARISTLGSWQFWEIILLTGVHEIIFSLSWAIFSSNLRNLDRTIDRGEFDLILTKPVSPRFLATFQHFNTIGLISLVNSLVLITVSFFHLSFSFTFFRLIGFILLIAIGLLISLHLHTLATSLTLAFIRAKSLGDILWEIYEIGHYPAEIYPTKIRYFFLTAIPVLLFAYLPTAFLLGKINYPWIIFALIILLLFSKAASFAWAWGLKKYQSISS